MPVQNGLQNGAVEGLELITSNSQCYNSPGKALYKGNVAGFRDVPSSTRYPECAVAYGSRRQTVTKSDIALDGSPMQLNWGRETERERERDIYIRIHIYMCKKSLYVPCDAPRSQSIKTALYVGKFGLGPNFPNFLNFPTVPKLFKLCSVEAWKI